jgi:hypothetical protein
MERNDRHVLQGSSERETLKLLCRKGKLNCERTKLNCSIENERVKKRERLCRHMREREKCRKEKNNIFMRILQSKETKFLGKNNFRDPYHLFFDSCAHRCWSSGFSSLDDSTQSALSAAGSRNT